MYEYIRGTLVRKAPNTAVIDANGVGFALEISLNTFESLPELQSQCQLLTYLYVREDAQKLFGFATDAERDLFLELTSVSGIGPKVSMGILSAGNVKEVKSQIVNEDVAALKRLPGIGPKTAKRIILELRETLATEDSEAGSEATPKSALQQEAMLALEALGYSKSQAERGVRAALAHDNSISSVEQLIKASLKTS